MYRTRHRPLWHVWSHLCLPQDKLYVQGIGHMWSKSIQHSWLHLCLPQLRFFVQRFLHRASSARVDRSTHFIIWSMLPQRHLTLVCLLHGGHAPSWHFAAKEKEKHSLLRPFKGRTTWERRKGKWRPNANLDTHADEPADRMLTVFDNLPYTMELRLYKTCVVHSSNSFFHKDMFSPCPASICSHHIRHHDIIAGIDDCHTSTAYRKLLRMNNSSTHYLPLCTTTTFAYDHNSKHDRSISHNLRTNHHDICVRIDVLYNSALCRTGRHTLNRLFDSIASSFRCVRNHIYA